MKQQIPAHPRAIAMLMAAVALPLTPVFAQEATPVAETVAPPVAAPPVAEPAAPPAAAPVPVFATSSPVVQAVPVRPVPPVEPVAEASQPATPRATTSRPAPRRDARTVPAPVAIAPVAVAPVPDVAPIAAPVEAPVAAETLPSTIPQPVPEPVTAVEPEVIDQTPRMLIAAGIAALAAIILGVIFMRRRGRKTVANKRPAYVAPAVVREPVAPIAPKPIMREPVQSIAPKPVAPVVATTGERPWIGLSLAPICAGTTDEGTMVQYELIVDNASDVEAHDVRVSSFLIDGARSSAAEQAMIAPLGETQTQTVDIAANGSVPITTTIHVNRNDLTADAFQPKIVAEARYPLPGGGEGHFAARFAIGITDGDAIKAVGLRDGDGMHDDVGAELDDVLERV